MPRFYFHIIANGRTIPDEEGMELPNLLAAQAEAVASERDLFLASGSRVESRTVQIVDNAGRILGAAPVLH
jgi:hypothetical protein